MATWSVALAELRGARFAVYRRSAIRCTTPGTDSVGAARQGVAGGFLRPCAVLLRGFGAGRRRGGSAVVVPGCHRGDRAFRHVCRGILASAPAKSRFTNACPCRHAVALLVGNRRVRRSLEVAP